MVIYPGLLRSEIMVTDGGHSFRVWLWETRGDLARWAYNYSLGGREPRKYDEAVGLFSPVNSLIHEPCQHLGELHFVKDRWDEEIVAHELAHLQFQYIRKVVEDFVRPLYQFYEEWMEWEEDLCYPFGKWHKWVYKWLWRHNPNPKWEKTEEEE